jgi:hypothetical protein
MDQMRLRVRYCWLVGVISGVCQKVGEVSGGLSFIFFSGDGQGIYIIYLLVLK